MAKGSLLEGAGFDSIGRAKRKPGKRGPGNNTFKLLLAFVLLIGAGLVLTWYYEVGPFGGSAQAAQPPTEEQRQIMKEQEGMRNERAKEPGMDNPGD